MVQDLLSTYNVFGCDQSWLFSYARKLARNGALKSTCELFLSEQNRWQLKLLPFLLQLWEVRVLKRIVSLEFDRIHISTKAFITAFQYVHGILFMYMQVMAKPQTFASRLRIGFPTPKGSNC